MVVLEQVVRGVAVHAYQVGEGVRVVCLHAHRVILDKTVVIV